MRKDKHDGLENAYCIITKGFCDIDDPEKPVFLPCANTCEKEIYISQLKNTLSEETREVLEMLMNCPTEIYEEITNEIGRPVAQKIKEYLKTCSLTPTKINAIFKELIKFKNDINSY